jgi:hypothetical protein
MKVGRQTMKSLRQLRIGYAPFSSTLEAPGDRRRFCYYARKRNLKFEFADPSVTYDLVVLSAAADISTWIRYRRGNAKVVYDLTDSYLAIPKLNPKGLLRGPAKFVARQNRHLLWSYTRGVRDMCRRADAVICTTAEQRMDILSHCDNVHIILDFQSSVARISKSDYTAGDVFNLVWEGLPGNLGTLHEVMGVLGELQKKRRLAIHAVTNLSYRKYLNGRFAQRSMIDLARKMPVPPYLYAWNEQTCSNIVCACDLAIIPIPLHDPLYAGKPENKLHLFWRMGMPTVVSATPAYSRAMDESGVMMACKTSKDWLNMLENYCCSEEARRNAGQQGKRYVDQQHSEHAMLARWDEMFCSILASTSVADSSPVAASEAAVR